MKFFLTTIVSVGCGLLIWRIDSLPNWDDTGITAGMILVAAGLISFANPTKPFIWALTVSIWIPFFAILNDHNFGALLALIFGFAGAYAGYGLRKIVLA